VPSLAHHVITTDSMYGRRVFVFMRSPLGKTWAD
jgi:hypothetical protein